MSSNKIVLNIALEISLSVIHCLIKDFNTAYCSKSTVNSLVFCLLQV